MTEMLHSPESDGAMKPAIDISELIPEQTSPVEEEKLHAYEVLTGYKRAESDEQLRTRYLRYTGGLIKNIAENNYDYVVYLDKSARPVQWLVSEFWDHFAPGKPAPQSKFINIDREDWRPSLGSPEYGDYHPDDLDISAIHELRDIFEDPSNSERAMFDGKKILIVDEVKVSGDTLKIAEDMFQRTFPSAEISGEWWMIPSTPLDNGSVDVPVWYRKDTTAGRGIGNKDAKKSLASPSRRQRVGPTFLSTRSETDDFQAKLLRAEIKQLRKDVDSGKQRVIPIDIE